MSSSNASTEDKAIQYLEDKYDKEFEVMYAKEGSKLFEDLYGGDLITVHPKGEPEIVFTIQEDGEGFVETYLPAKWAQELQEKLTTDISKELPPGTEFKLVLNKTRFKEDMSVEELLEKNKDMGVDLIVGIKTSGEPEISQYSQGIYNLYNLLKDLGLKNYLLSVGFVDESEDISEFITTSYVNNISWSNLDANVYGELGIDERHNPDNPSSIVDSSLILHNVDNVKEHYMPLGE